MRKTYLTSLIVAAERDEEVIIAGSGVPVAKLIKYTSNKVTAPGAWKGQVAYAADWNSAETNKLICRRPSCACCLMPLLFTTGWASSMITDSG